MVCHDHNLIRSVCNHAIRLEHRRIVAVGSVPDVPGGEARPDAAAE